MNCQNCGGKLKYIDGHYICINCNNEFSLPAYFENIDVFIAYIESDFDGRRTKDSIIAQEIYQKLETNNIKTFYQRISANDLLGKDFESACSLSAAKAEIIVLVGTNRKYFSDVIEKYNDLIERKTIIPVYADMEACDMPDQLQKIQAIKYNKVDFASDLIKNILHFLKRDNELDIKKEAEKKAIKKKRIAIIFSIILTILAFGIGAYFVFYNIMLPEKKYEEAQKMIQQEDYISAIDILTSMPDYKNSKSLLKGIYSKYAGYYYSYLQNIGMHFTIVNNKNALIELKRLTKNGSWITINESFIMNDGHSNKFYFTDSNNNKGEAYISILDTKIELNVVMQDKNSTDCFGNVSITFDRTDKSDRPTEGQITAEIINNWIDAKLTDNDIKSQGYSIEYIDTIPDAGQEEFQIENSDVRIALSEDEYYTGKISNLDEKSVVQVAAPAEIIAPELIGKSISGYVKNDIILYPATMDTNSKYFLAFYEYWPAEKTKLIERDTIVCCVSRKMVSENYWFWLKNKYAIDNDTASASSLYRVRKSADDASSQIGAYANLDNAKKDAYNHKSEGYKVYDDNGNLVYEP